MTGETPESLGLSTPRVPSTQSKLFNQIRKQAPLILKATILVVDPSIGSASSLPGYAVYRAGQLIARGLIEVATAGAHNLRLYEIARSLREDFREYFPIDILVVEDIPAMRFNRRGRGGYNDPRAQVPLHRAVGAVLSAIPAPILLEVSPSTWHAHTDPAVYIKSDVNDAIAMGWTVLKMAEYAIRVAEKPRRAPAKKKAAAREKA